MINDGATEVDELHVGEMAFHAIDPLVTPYQIIKIATQVWALAPWVQMVNASILAWDERHTGVKAGKALIFELLYQGIPLWSWNVISFGDMFDEVGATVVAGVITRLSALLA